MSRPERRSIGARRLGFDLREVGAALLLVAPMAVGLVARSLPILGPLPYGDGGLFYVMASELRHGTFPMFTSYNHAGIPFAYPPLGLILLAILPGDVLDLMRLLPALFSAAVIAAVYLLARELMSQRGAAVASAAYAVMPAGWALNGADSVRSLGVLLALLATWVAIRRSSPTGAMNAGLLGGLGALAHPSVFAYSLLTAGVAVVRQRIWSRILIMMMAGLVVTLPWILFVAIRYGPQTLLSAATAHVTSFPLARVATFGPTGLGPLDPLVGVAILGAVRRPWLGVWALLVVFMPATSDRYVAVAVGLLCGVGLETLPARFLGTLGPGFSARLRGNGGNASSTDPRHRGGDADRHRGGAGRNRLRRSQRLGLRYRVVPCSD